METLILASASPRRRDILTSAGIPFEVITSEADEHCAKKLSPKKLTVMLAERKRDAVYEKTGSDRLILAADTVVAINGQILGKPENEEDAYRMLSALSGSRHFVYSGIAMRKGDKTVTDCGVTAVYMRRLSDAEIRAYISTGEPFDKAGAYAVQERGGAFITKLNGSYHNVVGLPLDLVISHMISDFGIDVFS